MQHWLTKLIQLKAHQLNQAAVQSDNTAVLMTNQNAPAKTNLLNSRKNFTRLSKVILNLTRETNHVVDNMIKH